MENNSNNNSRQVNEKDVHPLSDLITVELLDWSKLNPDINEYVHARKPERQHEEFYFDDRFAGLIEINKKTCLLITKDVLGIEPKIFDYKQCLIGFTIGIFVKPEEGSGIENTQPEFDFSLTITDIPKIQTGNKLLLPDFMESRYRYNPRIEYNEIQLIEFLKEQKYKPFNKLKK